MRDFNTIYWVIFLVVVVGPPVLRAIFKVLRVLSEQAKRTAAGGQERDGLEELAPWIREPDAGSGSEEGSSDNLEEQRPVRLPWQTDGVPVPLSPQIRPRQVVQPSAPQRTGRMAAARVRAPDPSGSRRPLIPVRSSKAAETPPPEQILELLGSELAAKLHAPSATTPPGRRGADTPPAQAHAQRSQGETGRTQGGSHAHLGRAKKAGDRTLRAAVVWSEILAPPLALRGPWQ